MVERILKMSTTPPNPTELKSDSAWIEEAEVSLYDALIKVKGINKFIKNIQHNAMMNAATIANDTTFAPGKKNDYEEAYDKGCTDAAQAILTRASQILKGEK